MATEFVGIELQLMGAEGVRRDLKELDQLLKTLGGRKQFQSGFSEARAQVVAYKGELEKLKREYNDNEKLLKENARAAKELSEAYKSGAMSYNEFKDAIHGIAQENKAARAANEQLEESIEGVQQKLWNAQQAVREFGYANREAGKTFMQTFNSISSKIAHIGSSMQSLGNAMTNLTSPFSRFTTGAVMGLGFQAMNKFTEGLQNGFSRYDTMKKYPKIMKAFGYSAAEAEESVKALDMSVRGLPTGLDEMVDLAQRFTATSGDIQKGTQLAIATNNAFLASMSTDTQRYQGMMQLQDVLGGKDMNAREWNSLVSSMTPAIVKMGESLGYTSKNMDEWIQKVRDGKVGNQDFIDTLIKVGTENGEVAKMAQKSKDTWQAFFANVGNAASRMTAGVIESMDEVVKTLGLEDKDGKKIESVNRLLSDRIIPNIDKATASIKKWIQAHPDEIIDFFKELGKIDIKAFAQGVAEGLKEFAGIIKMLTGLGDGSVLPKWFGKRMIRWNWMGKGLTVLGGIIKGLRHPLALIGTMIAGKLPTIGIGGFFKKLLGKKKDLEDLEGMGEVMTKASPSLIKAFKDIALISGIVATPAITGFVITEAAKRGVSNFKQTVELLKDINWGDAKKVLIGIGSYLAGSAAIGGIVGKFGIGASVDILFGEVLAGLITSIASGFFALDMAMIKSGIKNFVDSVNALKEIPDIGDIGDITSRISNAIEVMNEISTLLEGEWKGLGEREGGIQGIGIFTSFNVGNIASAIGNLKKVADNVNAIGSMNISESAVSNVKNLVQGVSDISSSLWRMIGFGFGNISGNIENVANAMYQLRRVIYHMNKLGSEKLNESSLTSIIDAVKQISETMRTIGTEFNDAFVEAFDFAGINAAVFDGMQNVLNTLAGFKGQFKKRADELANEFKRTLQSKMKSVNVHTVININASLGGVWGITSVAAKVRNIAKDALSNITVNSKVNVNTNPGGHATPANGGLIYRAGGGNVPWRRRGTDTIPAMLTPGEFVQRKQAVSLFGLDFMRKVNSLDMKGAMNELMHRAGGMVQSRGNITNNYYNNNQRVTQNINTNNPSFAFKSASRFVGAF